MDQQEQQLQQQLQHHDGMGDEMQRPSATFHEDYGFYHRSGTLHHVRRGECMWAHSFIVNRGDM